MRKRLLSIMLVFSTLTIFLAGCGSNSDSEYASKSKAELIELLESYEATYSNLYYEFEEYKNTATSLDSEFEIGPAIQLTGDGTGRFTFKSYDSKIVFPSSFQYPGAESTPGNGTIDIASNVTITPSSNWIVRINGSTIELENTSSGISGTIKVGAQYFLYGADSLQSEVLSQWFQDIPASHIKYTNIYVSGQPYGCQAALQTTIDSEDAFLRCGMLGVNDMCITYIFVYRGQPDSDKDESITTLINTINICGSSVKAEQ